MQSDLGGEALFLYPRDQFGTALISHMLVYNVPIKKSAGAEQGQGSRQR